MLDYHKKCELGDDENIIHVAENILPDTGRGGSFSNALLITNKHVVLVRLDLFYRNVKKTELYPLDTILKVNGEPVMRTVESKRSPVAIELKYRDHVDVYAFSSKTDASAWTRALTEVLAVWAG